MEMTPKYGARNGHSSMSKGKILILAISMLVALSSFIQPIKAETSVNARPVSNPSSSSTVRSYATSNDSTSLTTGTAKSFTSATVVNTARDLPARSKQATKLSKLRLNTPSLEADYASLIESIDSTLIDRYDEFKREPRLLNEFVEQQILPYWNVELTLKQLLGSKHWNSLTKQEITSVKQTFVDTLNRYVGEGMKFYDGQRIKFSKVKINKKQTRGLLTLTLEPIYLPAFNVSFKIANQNEQWQLYDVMVEGISYVKMKKGEYRQLVDKAGIKGLLAHLDKKNQASTPDDNQQQAPNS